MKKQKAVRIVFLWKWSHTIVLLNILNQMCLCLCMYEILDKCGACRMLDIHKTTHSILFMHFVYARPYPLHIYTYSSGSKKMCNGCFDSLVDLRYGTIAITTTNIFLILLISILPFFPYSVSRPSRHL